MFRHQTDVFHIFVHTHTCGATGISLTECCRQALLAAAGEMGVSGGRLLQLCGEATVDPKTQVRKRATHRKNKALRFNIYGVLDLLML